MGMITVPAEMAVHHSYPIDPEAACGGVWLAVEKCFVEVKPAGTFCDPATGVTGVEYNDADGRGRACLLNVPAGGVSPTWRIKAGAFEPNAGMYFETHQAVSGQGEFMLWPPEDSDYPHRPDVLALPRVGEVVHVFPREAFTIRAVGDTALQVLATFPLGSFSPEFETQITRPDLRP
jgi:hypothetical protein